MLCGSNCVFYNSLPIYRKLCFCFFQRFHSGVELGEQFFDPGNDTLLLRERRNRKIFFFYILIMTRIPSVGHLRNNILCAIVQKQG